MDKLRTKTFIEHFEQGDRSLDLLVKSSVKSIVDSAEAIKAQTSDIVLQGRIEEINTTLITENKSPFEKVVEVGKIINNLSREIFLNENENVRDNGIKLLSNYLSLVKQSNDSRLIGFANDLVKQLTPLIR